MDPACCKGKRHGLCADNNVSSELSDIFPEQVICCIFRCYYVPALEPRSSCSSFDVVGRSKSRGDGKPPLLLTAAFMPHEASSTQDTYAVRIMGDVTEYSDASHASIQQVVEALNKSDAINCFFRQPELTEYEMHWYSKHGAATFCVEKESMERTVAPKTRRRYNTRASTRSGSR